MAKQKSKESSTEWVDQIAADPANVPPVRLLCGYPGKSPEKGCRRIYLHPDLSDWVDVPAQDVLYEEAVRDASPSGLAHVWVKREAGAGGHAGYPQPEPPIYAASTLNMRDCQPYTAYCQSQTCIAPTGRHPAPPPPGYPHPHPHPGFWWCPTIPYRGC